MPASTATAEGGIRRRFAHAGCSFSTLLALGALAMAAAGEGGDLSLVLDGQPAQAALALAGRLGAGEHQRDTGELAAGAGAQPITLSLVHASAAGLRQALAHAQGCWWLGDERGTFYSSHAAPPPGPLTARTCTSGLVGQPGLEAQVRGLLAPWLADPACGLSYLPDEGLWTATLDGAGHARLVEILTLLERDPAQCPPLLADPDQPPADRRLAAPLLAAGWSDLAAKLAAALAVSVSCAPDLPPAPPAIALAPGTIAEVGGQLAALGARGAVLHGVLCLGREVPRERQHPALRRRLAHLPVAHLVADGAEGELLAAQIRARVAPWWWSLPGAALFYQADRRALVVAADPETLHGVMDLLDRADLLGLEQALAEPAP